MVPGLVFDGIPERRCLDIRGKDYCYHCRPSLQERHRSPEYHRGWVLIQTKEELLPSSHSILPETISASGTERIVFCWLMDGKLSPLPAM